MPAIAAHSSATVDSPWDAAANERRVKTPLTQERAARIYAWREAGSWPQEKSGYRFIHHLVGSDGNGGAASIRACSAGIAVLNGGRGGTTIPAADREGVHRHLAKHLRDAGREPPPLKSEEELREQTVLDDFGELEAEPAASAGEEEVELIPLSAFGHSTWVIRPDVLPRLVEARRVSEASALLAAATRAAGRQAATRRIASAGASGGAVAIVPLTGVLMPRPSLLSILFGGGGGGLMTFRQAFREAVNSPDVSSIVIDVDSPGGMVSLVPETADEVRAARDSKPIVAVANTLAASGAYWIAAQADELIVTPSGEAGSIGVYAVHSDWSKWNEARGVIPQYVSAGKYKIEGNPDEPLSDAGREQWQAETNDIYDQFVEAVAEGRGVKASAVRNGYGEGRSLLAQRALDAGLVDRIEPMTGVLKGLVGTSTPEPQNGPSEDEQARSERERRAARARVLLG